MLRPLHNEVQVRIEKDKVFGVLHLPDLYRDKKVVGVVVARGRKADPALVPGAFVLVENYNQPIKEAVADLIIPDTHICAILEEPEGIC